MSKTAKKVSPVKRQASSPLQGVGKEAKAQESTPEKIAVVRTSMEIDQTATPSLTYASVAASTSSSASASGSTSGGRQKNAPVFKTKTPEGAFRDEIVVEIISINGQAYRGTVTPSEARLTIFERALGFPRDALAGCMIGFNKGRIVTYKLKEVFDIDSLHMLENFTFERKTKDRDGNDVTATLSCRIRGIMKRQEGSGQSFVQQPREEGVRWLKIEGCEYRVEKDQLTSWLQIYGELRSEITEDDFEEESDTPEGYPTIGNGNYSVLIKLHTKIPQLIPMNGKRVRMYHRGITKLCSNCYGAHERKSCKNEKVQWIQYVKDFMTDYPDIPQDYYGKWYNAVESWLKEIGRTKPRVQAVDQRRPENVESEKSKESGGRLNNPDGMMEGVLASLRQLPQTFATFGMNHANQKKTRTGEKDAPEGLNTVQTPNAEGAAHMLKSKGFSPSLIEKSASDFKKKEASKAGRGRGRRKNSLNDID